MKNLNKNLHISEKELIDGLVTKDKKYLEMLYDNYSGALYGVALVILKNKEMAEEVLQDTFLKIWNNISQYKEQKGRLYTWMINILRHQAIDKLRSADFKKTSKTEGLASHVYYKENTALNESAETIGARDLLSKVDENHRLILELIYFQGYTQAEISQEFDIPLGTVKTRLRSALIQLRKHIGIN